MPKRYKLIEISFVEKKKFKFKFPKIKKGKYFYLNFLSFITLLSIPIFYYVESSIISNYQRKLTKLDRIIYKRSSVIRNLINKLNKKQKIFERLYISDIKEKYFISRLYKYFNKAVYNDFVKFHSKFKENLYSAFIVFPNPQKLNNHLLLPYFQGRGNFLENKNPFSSNLNIATSIAIYVKKKKNESEIKELNLIRDKNLKTNLEFQIFLLNNRELEVLIPITLVYPVGFFYKNEQDKLEIFERLKENCDYFIKSNYFEYSKIFGGLRTEGYIQGFCIRNIWYKVRDEVW